MILLDLSQADIHLKLAQQDAFDLKRVGMSVLTEKGPSAMIYEGLELEKSQLNIFSIVMLVTKLSVLGTNYGWRRIPLKNMQPPCSELSAKKRKMPTIIKSGFGKRLKHSISLPLIPFRYKTMNPDPLKQLILLSV